MTSSLESRFNFRFPSSFGRHSPNSSPYGYSRDGGKKSNSFPGIPSQSKQSDTTCVSGYYNSDYVTNGYHYNGMTGWPPHHHQTHTPASYYLTYHQQQGAGGSPTTGGNPNNTPGGGGPPPGYMEPLMKDLNNRSPPARLMMAYNGSPNSHSGGSSRTSRGRDGKDLIQCPTPGW